jgi:hypothetical protein
MRITIRKVERYSFLAFSIIVFLCLKAETRMREKETAERPAKVEHYINKYKYLSIELSQNQGGTSSHKPGSGGPGEQLGAKQAGQGGQQPISG